jgi:threonine dehydrogenase-like Zn-dependent dehydrogenase
MKALTFAGIEQISYETVEDPVLVHPTDVIVQVKQCAICGSDLHAYFGREHGLDPHTTMGHEFTGVIVDAGKDVRKLKIGDRVMSPFTTNCGECFYCLTGLTCRCIKGQLFGWVQNGQGLQGGQAGYVRIPLADTTLERIPDGVSFEEGLLLGDVLSTGFYCAERAEIKSDGVYVIIGCGPVGLMSICGAKEYGAEKVFAIDTVAERLQRAEAFGARSIHPGKENVMDIVYSNSDGRGADAVMEAVGNQSAGELACRLIRPGGIISAVGVCNDQHLPFSPADAYNKNLTYKVGRCPARYMMQKLIPLVQNKKYNFTSIFSHRIKLHDGVHGYDIFANKKDKCLKVLMEVS